MTDAMLDAQYRDQVERWWSPQALSEIHRLLCTVAPLYRETGEHSAIEMSPKDQVSWLCQKIDRLRTELATHCECRFESTSQNGGCDLVERCDFHASEEEYLVLPLRAEIERLKSDLSGVTEECANLLKIKARLEAEKAAAVSSDAYERAIRALQESRAEVERLRAERDALKERTKMDNAAREAGEER